jgi:endonuclease YncB( thermonuclease family)
MSLTLRALTFAFTFVLSACPATATARDLSCKVVGIADGDTLTALCPGKERIKVRLAEIDAPEKAQPYGTQSRHSLSELCFHSTARIHRTGIDTYGRTLARVTCNGTDVNAEQVRRGLAWVYDHYVKDARLYPLQHSARSARTGLWADPDPVPPWKWRRTRSNRPKPARAR